jgi:5-methylcytosine-specific restriction endonuclease McrA
MSGWSCPGKQGYTGRRGGNEVTEAMGHFWALVGWDTVRNRTEQSAAPDCLQRPLVPRSRFQQQVSASVRLPHTLEGVMTVRTGECVYCGRFGRLTDDHVPPQALCSKPRPSDLVLVPSCQRCNGGASKDDEYFKTMMVFKDRAGSHPEAVAIRASVFRGLAMPKKTRFTQRILGSMRPVALRTPAGLHVGRTRGFNVDLARLDRVVARITRGLYWPHHNHVRLPDDHEVAVWSEDGLRDIAHADALQLRSTLVDPILHNPARSIGREVLRYWYASGDREHVTGWLFEFYGDVRFVAFTVPSARSHSAEHMP